MISWSVIGINSLDHVSGQARACVCRVVSNVRARRGIPAPSRVQVLRCCGWRRSKTLRVGGSPSVRPLKPVPGPSSVWTPRSGTHPRFVVTAYPFYPSTRTVNRGYGPTERSPYAVLTRDSHGAVVRGGVPGIAQARDL